MTYIIGIFGKIGAGKSTFISLLKEYIKADFFSADFESRELWNDPNYVNVLKSYFLECVNGGELDKKALKNLIFQSEEKNDLLKSLSHPLIRSRLIKKIEEATEKVVFVEISVFVKDFLDFDEFWLITANTSKQVKRLSTRDNIDEKTAYNRINFQYIPEEKIFSQIIVNDGSLSSLSKKAKDLANEVKTALNLDE